MGEGGKVDCRRHVAPGSVAHFRDLHRGDWLPLAEQPNPLPAKPRRPVSIPAHSGRDVFAVAALPSDNGPVIDVAPGRFEEMVTALSLMSNVPTAAIERNMRDTHAESLLVIAKAIGLSWETTRSIMLLAAKRNRRSVTGVDQAMAAFQRLRQSTAQQILDFHHLPTRPARGH
jgi:hypothetical protein